MPYILGLFQETCMQDLRKCIISYEPQNRLELGRGCPKKKIAEIKIFHYIFFLDRWSIGILSVVLEVLRSGLRDIIY